MLRARWFLLVLFVVVDLFMGWQVATRLVIDNSQDRFLNTSSDAYDSMIALEEAFGSDELFIVQVDGDVFTMAFLERLRGLHEELSRIDVALVGELEVDEGAKTSAEALAEDEWAGLEDDDGWGEETSGSVIEHVTSLVNVRRTSWKDGALNVAGLLDDWPQAEELPDLRVQVLSDVDLVGNVVSDDGRHALLVIQPIRMEQPDTDAVLTEILAITQRYEATDFGIHVGGAATLYSTINHTAARDLVWLAALESLVLMLCLFGVYRHPIGALAPLVAVGQASLWTMGVMVMLGMSLTIVTSVLWAFLLCVGVGGAIHVQSVYRDARRDGRDNVEAIVYAVSTTGVPVFLTSATTVVGLLSFGLATLPPIQSLGYLSALGVTIAFAMTLTFVPIALSFNHSSLMGVRPRKGVEPDGIDRIIERCNALSASVSGRLRTIGVIIALTLCAFAGMSQLDVTHDSLNFLPRNHPVKTAFRELDAHFGGSNTMALLIEALPGKDVQDRELLGALEELEEHLLAFEDPHDGLRLASNSTGILDGVRESWGAVNFDRPEESGKLPPTSRGVTDMLTLFSNSDPNELARMVTLDRKKALLTVRVLWRDSGRYRPLVEHMREGVQRYIGDKAVVKPAGTVLNHFSVEQEIVGDLVRSFGTATAVIAVLIMLMLRDLRLAAIAMVPNLFPIAVVLGLMGFVGIKLDVQNLLVASVVIGIAVDDTIHFMHQFKAHHAMHGDIEAAIAFAFQHAGRAIIATSIILMAGFGAFLAGSTQNVQTFGMLTGFAVLAALFADLVFAPALLRLAYRSAKS